MPKQGWSRKRERHYGHVKDSEVQRGHSEEEAKEIAARTVNKERARKGETEDSHRDADGDHATVETKAELMAEAKRRGIEGRSTMSKAELRASLGR
ncbi:MAG: plasmid stabilization protein [Actinobacteria bacterium HGW-Actinobacteria-4]|nr:MAG: plasmid stabilization protein [Actinobacteria bacterium HGW-Actinobacteria-4]